MSGGQYPPSYHHIQPPKEFVAPRHRLPIIPPQGPPPSSFNSSTISHAHTTHPPWINKHNFATYHDNSSFYSQTTPKNYSSPSKAHQNEESSWSEPPFSNPTPINAAYRVAPQNDKMDSRICDYSKDDEQEESMDLSSASHVSTITSSKITELTVPSNPSVNGSPSDEANERISPVNGTAKCEPPKKEAVSVIATNPLRGKALIVTPTPNLVKPVVETTDDTKITKKLIPSDRVESILETMFHSDTKSSVTSTTSSVIVTAQSCKRAKSVEKILKSPSPERTDNPNSNFDFNSTKETESTNIKNSAIDLTTELTKTSQPDSDEVSKHPIEGTPTTDSTENIEQQLALLDGVPDEKPEPDLIKDNCDKPVNVEKCAKSNEKPREKGKNEITYVEVETELEKMFAGIEDNEINVDADPLNAVTLDSSITDTSKTSPSRTSDLNLVAKSAKKKSSKKSKSTSVKKDTKKISKDTDNITSKRVPVIHVCGSKENPISVQIINSIKLEEDDISDAKTAAKRKQGKSDRANKRLAACYSVKNYDPVASDESWICIFCKLSAHSPGVAGEPSGELFGPYFIRNPNQLDTDSDSKRHSRKTDHLTEQAKKKKLKKKSKKQKRSLSMENNRTVSNYSEHKSLEIWAHENCFVWASGIHLVGSKLMGLEDAVIEALRTVCSYCGENGASIGCRTRHCNNYVHYSCALYTGWKLNSDTFMTVCDVHKGTQ